MKKLTAFVSFCLVLSGTRAVAQPPMPKPTAEHEALKKFDGDWDASVSFMGTESKGAYHAKVGLGGFWLVGKFEGEVAGQKFEGRGTMGYDPSKKKYVSTWIDSMNPALTVMEGSFDADSKTYTESGEGVGPDMKPQKMKSVYTFPDADTINMTMYNIADGKEQEAFKITYKRKK